MRIERRKGDTRPDVCYVTFACTGEPVNVTGCSFKMVVSTVQFPNDTAKILFETTGTISDAANGEVEFHPSADVVSRTGYFYFEVKMTDIYGDIHTPVYGSYDFK